MNRSAVLALCTAIFSGCAPPGDAPNSGAAAEAASSRPRVVLLLSLDTLRADHLGFYGYEKFTSPVLDLVASEGVVFEDASSTSPWTLPAHASMLTGRTPKQHGVRTMETALPAAVPTLAALLADAGFETAAVVNSTWLQKERFRITRDFERYGFVKDVVDRRAPSSWVTDQAIGFLDEVRDRPLLLFVHYYDVHSDYVSEPAYEELFTTPYDGIVDGSSWQLVRANLDEWHLEFCRKQFTKPKCMLGDRVLDESVEKLYLGPDDVRRVIELYDAGIRQLDAELSRLFSWMRREGVLDETLLVVTSDHGEQFQDHGHFEHLMPVWQELLRVPLVLRGPGVHRGVRVAAPVSQIDLVPTILSLVGVEAPEGSEGIDLSPLVTASGDSLVLERRLEERHLYGEAAGGLSYEPHLPGVFSIDRSVRRGRYKLVWSAKGGTETHALYDLEADPGETVDLRERHPEVAAELLARLEDRFTGDVVEPHPDNRVELEEEEAERLRALGYIQ